MELRVNDYVRTDKGYIAKISDFIEHYTKGKRLGIKDEVIENYLLFDNKHCEIIESIDYSIPPCYPSDEELAKIKSHIVKSSPNIIDLIEVGDYVNGLRVNEISEHTIWLDDMRDFDKKDKNFVISIVTREQFESMEYRIGE